LEIADYMKAADPLAAKWNDVIDRVPDTRLHGQFTGTLVQRSGSLAICPRRGPAELRAFSLCLSGSPLSAIRLS